MCLHSSVLSQSTNIDCDYRFKQLEDNLQSLREDTKTLKKLVEKYDKIEDIRGRRLLFIFKESSDLSDLRRRIGLHEQTLQLWYMTLVYGSLRRLETGQEEIFSAIKNMNRDTLATVVAELRRGNEKLLKKELRKKGVSEEKIQENLDVAKVYVEATPPEKVRIESESRARSSSGPGGLSLGYSGLDGGSAPAAYPYPPRRPYSPEDRYPRGDLDFSELKSRHPGLWPPSPPPNHHRSKSANATKYDEDYPTLPGAFDGHYSYPLEDDPSLTLAPSKPHRRSSNATPHSKPNPLLVVPQHRTRPASYHSPAHTRERSVEMIYKDDPRARPTSYHAPPRSPRLPVVITHDDTSKDRIITDPERRRRHGSPTDSDLELSERARRQAVYQDRGEDRVIVERLPPRRRRGSSAKGDGDGDRSRGSSTHSFVRRRPEGDVGGIRMVEKMDRIDSMDAGDGRG